MNNKIILITGATSGIGKAAAFALAKKNHTIIIHGRSKQKALLICEEIKKETGNQNIEMLIADMYLLSDVRKMADHFKLKYNRLDVLINNAGGMMGKKRETTTEGLEKTMAVNLLAPFLLTELLLDCLKKSPEARIVNVSSDGHKFTGRPDLTDLQFEKKYKPLDTYVKAKLFLIWISRHLDKLLKQNFVNNITVNALHPGNVRTNFYAVDQGFLLNLIVRLTRPFYITAEEGADTIVYLASSDEVKNISGGYFANRKKAKTNDKYYSIANEQLIWDYCERLTKPFKE
jgi:NAD(P)-dependent dehydrogenase (short-subunit alcohol dehydrogenase family)